MKKIPLYGVHGAGKFAIVDDDDFESLNQFKWHLCKGYAGRIEYLGRENKQSIRRGVFIHRVVTGAEPGQHTDHINGNKLDNRKSNLRACNRFQNLQNIGISKRNKSGYKGVHWHKKAGKWVAEINAFGQRHYLGLFTELEQAAQAYKRKSQELHKEFSKTD